MAKARFDGANAKDVETKTDPERLGPLPKERKHWSERWMSCRPICCSKPAIRPRALARLNKANDVDEAFLAEVEVLAGNPDGRVEATARLELVEARTRFDHSLHLSNCCYRQQKKDEAKQTFQKHCARFPDRDRARITVLFAAAGGRERIRLWERLAQTQTDRSKCRGIAGTFDARSPHLAACCRCRLVTTRR